MRRRFLFSSVLAFGMAFGVTVQPASADTGSDELGSSMTATCVGMGGSCDVVDFYLDIEGSMFMKDVVLESMNGWAFGSVLQVWDNDGNNPTWTSSVSADELTLFSASGDATWDPEPIRFRVSTTSQGASLTDIRYTANGYAGPEGTGGFFSAQGNVVPEPITTVLLGTGLAGLAGVRARRRKEGVEEGENEA